MLINYIKQLYRELILVQYISERYTHPDRNRKLKPKKQMSLNVANHEIIGTGAWVPDDDFMDGSSQFALSKADENSLLPGRTKQLSEEDIETLSERNLNVAKAVRIKPFWALGYSREEISAALSHEGGKRVSGYSVSTVGSICAAFSATVSQDGYGTLSRTA